MTGDTKAATKAASPKGSSPKTDTEPSPPPGPSIEPDTTEELQPDNGETQDNDSFISEIDSSTASLSSSILAYRTHLGRTYHSERGNANYWGANDRQQMESMDLSHHSLTFAIGDKLALAPIRDDIQKALDVGTGTGLWAIDFADMYPNCSVIGTDLSPIQPSWVPPNLEFHIDDCTSPWTLQPGTFDYVHMRYLLGSIIDWYQLFAEAFKTLKSGGYVESYEAAPWIISDDGTVVEGSAMWQWGELFVSASDALGGRTFTVVPDGLQRKGMEAAGFVDIEEHDLKHPFGVWPKNPRHKQMGKFAQVALEQDIEGYVSFVASLKGWSPQEITMYAVQLRKELRDTRIHGYAHSKIVWGRKP